MEKDYQDASATSDFIRNSIDSTVSSPAYIKWAGESVRTRADADSKESTQKAQEILKSVDGQTEREKSRERIAEIVLKEGGIRINTSIRSSLSPRGNAGYQNLETRVQGRREPRTTLGNIEAQFFSKNESHVDRLDTIMKKHGIKELIDIRHDKKHVYETVTVPGKKGVFGFGKTPDTTEQRYTGRSEAVLHSEAVSGGKQEPVVRITYFIPQGDWKDYSGRAGQYMLAEILLPDLAAKEVERVLEQDPAVIRRIIERVMKEKLLKDPGAWETPPGPNTDSLRPPYDKWDAEPNGGKIYIQNEGSEPGFHEENFRKVAR
jgi:hypothetical protein